MADENENSPNYKLESDHDFHNASDQQLAPMLKAKNIDKKVTLTIGRDIYKNICNLQLYIGLSLFDGRLCCDFSTVFEFTTVFLITGAFGAGNRFTQWFVISRATDCVIPGAEGACD